jgi:hypothetical protein
MSMFGKISPRFSIEVTAMPEIAMAMKSTRRIMSRVLNSFCSTVAANLPSTRLFKNMATITTNKSAVGMAMSREGIDSTINKRDFYAFSQKGTKNLEKNVS